ncbi:large-conductance mechanosensitive channel [Robertmurraya siralis]|uniref:Large-conductance mechanosensitive channel n=1 Tax=Robertmurraya siralis TaxID=77777 RepID=A0A919WKG6_9BACI|nr:large conductance mechanosensitive channel protein MscL [Robertmurraya siralis]PAE18554.1 large-conductance mechanosensitive channel [Bacillus sp. 7504-2]GIN63735.1 large-conductance mechanosensitive channel [Robertmurraya siralis]
MWNEFKQFAMKGNVIDLAVGVVIGAAFGQIVTSLVEDLIMPLVGLLIGGLDFTEFAVTIGKAEVKYGLFIQNIVNFLIIAFSIFLVIRVINRLKRKEEVKEEAPKVDTKEELLKEIRDLLKEK